MQINATCNGRKSTSKKLWKKAMKAQNTINLGQISGEMKTWNTFILGSKGISYGLEKVYMYRKILHSGPIIILYANSN